MLPIILLIASAQVSLPDAPVRDVDSMSRLELKVELHRIEVGRPGLVAPIVLIGAGLAADLGSSAMSIVSGLAGIGVLPIFDSRTQQIVFWTGIGLTIGALVVAGAGALWLRFRLWARRPWSEAMDRVQERLVALVNASG